MREGAKGRAVTDIEAIMHEATTRRLAVEVALREGRRRFRDRSRPAHSLTVTPSTRPDCPPGHLQLTRWDGDEPTGHTCADNTRGDWVAVAREVRWQGFDA